LWAAEHWRIRNNDELDKLMRIHDIVKYIRAQRVNWWAYLNRMVKGNKGKVYPITGYEGLEGE
jgi:hypothetical protein